MNDLDPKTVIVASMDVPSDVFQDEAEAMTAPVTIVPRVSVPIRAVGHYLLVGPRRSSRPLPATSHLAPTAVIPKLRQFNVRTWRLIAIAVTVFAAVSALAAWVAIWLEVFWR